MSEWKTLLDPQIQDFIRIHEHDDVRGLGLKKPPDPAWPYALILDQIHARQKAALKIPQWLKRSGVVFPAVSTLEQASSATTARYKAGLVSGRSFIDLSGGAGVDSWAMLERFESGVVVDSDINAAQRIEHNLRCLSDKNATVKACRAEDFVAEMEPCDIALIDPQRRTSERKGLYKLEDCSPNVFDLLPILKEKAQTILLKTSPMLDIQQAIEQLGCVQAVHIVEWQGECKEVLYLLKAETLKGDIPIIAVRLDDTGVLVSQFSFTYSEELDAVLKISGPLRYLYEPSPAFMKAGGFKMMAHRFGLSKLHAHTHLYTSQDFVFNFPGRAFEIFGVYPVQAKNLPVQKANLSVRNFPADVQSLRKKLKLKDGGEDSFFACTLMDENGREKHVLIHCRRAFE